MRCCIALAWAPSLLVHCPNCAPPPHCLQRVPAAQLRALDERFQLWYQHMTREGLDGGWAGGRRRSAWRCELRPLLRAVLQPGAVCTLLLAGAPALHS